MLEAIGLSTAESRLYTTLIDNPQSSAAELAQHCGVSHRLAARSLALFARRGLASRLPGQRARYVAVAPDVSIQPMLSRREDELHQVRTAIHDLTAAFHRASRHTHPAQQVEVVIGAQNILSRAFALQDGAQAQFRGIDKPPYVMPGNTGNADHELRRLGEGIEYRVVYDREAVSLPGKLADIRLSYEHGEKVRVAANTPLKLWIADDTAALIPIRSDAYAIDAAFILHPSALLDAVIALFELEWKRGIPIRTFLPEHRGRSRPLPQPDELNGNLLGLLSAGLTDEAIARSLGLGLRTVQRRIHDLMQDLNADSRFQAGMVARERGWV